MDVAKWKELFRDYSVFGGELLVTKLGEPPGTCAIYPIGLGPAMVTPDVIRMTLDERIALPQYVMYYLNSSLGRRFTSGAAYGTTRQRVTLPLFRELPVPLPPPAEQRYIITELERLLSSLEASDCMMVAGLQRSSRLRQSILKRAFEGKLVPQDPKDEPAELLLNRIRGKEEQDSGSNVGARRRRNKTSVKRSIEK